MTTDDEIKYDRSLLGVSNKLGQFPVTSQMILDFAQSTGETNPVHSDEAKAQASEFGSLIAPPTFCNVFVNGLTRPDIKLEFGDIGFFAGQAVESLAPIRPGDTLNASTMLKEVYAKTGRSGTMVFAVWETSFTNQNDDDVARVQESYVRRNSRAK
ncbi:MAG: MaoC family dehydratase N-terminal domain-containing protein [Chloroflexi bacterium]|nr:MaoC family dehydratase N-terminal domain-containing protein [Chloroflexota bacterium]MDA1229008.1 MaoC family dehydratase N-terminal domain-containing protein [Chloroflexota bacterium]